MSCVKSARSADMQRDSSKRSAHGGRNAIATETENPADSERKRSEAGTPSAEKSRACAAAWASASIQQACAPGNVDIQTVALA